MDYYAINNSDVLNAVSTGALNNVFEHFQSFGETENRAPTEAFAGFDGAAYLAANADVAAAVTAGTFKSALDHFIAFGQNEARSGGVTIAPVAGSTLTLTNSVDAPTATANADTVTGVFGSGTASENTYASGDIIDGLGGSDTLSLTAIGATAAGAVTVQNVETITVKDTLGATVNALLFANDPAVNFTNTIDAQTSTVTNGQTGSTYGLAGAGDMTITYAGVTGTSDTAKLSLSGTGSSTNSVAVNVSSTNAIEAATIATTGSNFMSLTGGTGLASL